MIDLPNFLLQLNNDVMLHGVSDILKRLHNENPEILKRLKGKIHVSTYYNWLSGKTPISLKFLKLIVDSENIWNELFETVEHFSIGMRKCVLPKHVDSKLAYLIGVLHGDGSLHKNCKFITVTTESKKYLSEIIDNLFYDLFGIRGILIEFNKGTYYRLDIGSKVVHSFLSMFCPVGRKKGNLKIPKIILNDNELLKSYLSGLFDTDGSFPHKPTKGRLWFVFSQVDIKFVNEIYKALLKLNIDVNKPRLCLSTNSPYDRRRELQQSRIYIGSKATLKKFISTMIFLHPAKKERSKTILNMIDGSGEI